MRLDLTLELTPQMVAHAQHNENKALVGHLGTHFDVMNHVFPLDYTERIGVVFDVSHVEDRDIDLGDIDIAKIEANMFVAFHTGFIEKVGYGSPDYFSNHPQLSHGLIDGLVQRGVSIIGVDFAGVRRGKEHTPKDQYCADRGVFIVENLCNLKEVLGHGGRFTANTYPMRYAQMTGLPCRVIAKI